MKLLYNFHTFQVYSYQYKLHSIGRGMHLGTIPGILDILNAFLHLINSIICPVVKWLFSYMFIVQVCIFLPLFFAVCCAPVFAYVFEWSNM